MNEDPPSLAALPRAAAVTGVAFALLIGALVGAAVGGALTHRSGIKRRPELEDSIPGMGTSTADIAANYWRDRGHPPLMKPPSPPPDQHIHDPDRLA